MEKKPYHHKNLKNDLIEKGIELVNKNGINQLSLRKVAQACGVSHADHIVIFLTRKNCFKKCNYILRKSLQKYSKIQFPNIEGHLFFYWNLAKHIFPFL